MTAFMAVFVRSFLVNFAVIVKKTGIEPSGLMSVKKEVK
jgi:hypothetical protein